MSNEYVIYCDESEKTGYRYSNFYGGALVRLQNQYEVIDRLNEKKHDLNFFGEVKWQKVTTSYLEPYHREHEYFILYYQFLKHAFGLRYSNEGSNPIKVRIYFDKLPDTREKNQLFKDFVYGLNRSVEFRRAQIRIMRDQLAEVTSHKHVILQCLDVVLGAMQFRLNNKHKIKPAGARQRGKRTIAKERLYKHINRQIREIYPYFNIGISTGLGGEIVNLWRHSYRHWLFVPKNTAIESGHF